MFTRGQPQVLINVDFVGLNTPGFLSILFAVKLLQLKLILISFFLATSKKNLNPLFSFTFSTGTVFIDVAFTSKDAKLIH